MAAAGAPAVVVLRALKLGDLLTAVPALRALRRSHPGHRLLLAAPAWLDALARHTGAVDEVVATDGLQPLHRSLHGADLAVNLHGRGPRSTALLAAAHPRRLLAFDMPGRPAWREEEHERHRWCRLLTESGIPADPDDLLIERSPVEPPPAAVGATLLHPGASAPARQWPVERWAAVARAEAAAGRAVVLTGSASEADLARVVARRAGLGAESVLAGRTGLLDLVAAVDAAAVTLSGDTGVAHVASARRRPSVILFGPTPPAHWGPPEHGPHRVLWRGRCGDPGAGRPDPGLLAITTDEVVAALDEVRHGVPAAR